MANKYDANITGWFTRGGKRIPIKEKSVEVPPHYSQPNIDKAKKRLSSSKYEDGTYEAESLAPLFYSDGFQVTFSQIGDSYTDEQFIRLVAKFLSKTDDFKLALGKFEGEPEVSFHVKSQAVAERLAKAYNQKSIWDWANMAEIATGGTGVKE